MFQKDMRFAYLADFYGELLDEHTRAVIIAYYDDDLSLSEIADGEGISRQGVHDTINRTEAALLQMEQAIGCIERAENVRKAMGMIRVCAEALSSHQDPTVRKNAERILSAVASVKE